jgi:hypothetical protein
MPLDYTDRRLRQMVDNCAKDIRRRWPVRTKIFRRYKDCGLARFHDYCAVVTVQVNERTRRV